MKLHELRERPELVTLRCPPPFPSTVVNVQLNAGDWRWLLAGALAELGIGYLMSRTPSK